MSLSDGSTNPNPNTNLQSIEPSEAARLFHESRVGDVSARTHELDKKRVGSFVEWLEAEDIGDMTDVTARTVHEWRLSEAKDVAASTMRMRVSTVRLFVRFCESIDAMPEGTAERVMLPNPESEVSTTMLDPERAEAMLDYYKQFDYASRKHAMLAVLWHTGVRTGTIHGLDVDDLQEGHDRLRVRHRPDTDTPLKNKQAAERYVALSPDVSALLRDYVEHNRTDVEDDHGRDPLFTTHHGRMPKETIRRNIYAATRPCAYGEGCPHDKDPSTCEAASGIDTSSKCPSSVSGHPIRRGSITHFLRKDVPEKVVSDRMNVSQDVLDKHYDRRTEDEKMEQRRRFLDNV